MKTIFFAIVLSTTKVFSSSGIDFDSQKMSCQVLAQDNQTEFGAHPIFSNAKSIELNGSYKPFNVVIDGHSANEILMGLPGDIEETRLRTKQYMIVKKNNEDALVAEMDNDWDTYFMDIDLKGDYDNVYRGMIRFLWGDSYHLFVRCHAQKDNSNDSNEQHNP